MNIKKGFLILLQVAAICGFYELIARCAKWLAIPLPANVLGMVIMSILLITGILPMHLISEGADFLLKYMPVFFVPLGVAMMNYVNLIQINGAVLIPVLIGTSVLVAAVTGYSSMLWQKANHEKKESSKDVA